jgi:hypothetical protein
MPTPDVPRFVIGAVVRLKASTGDEDDGEPTGVVTAWIQRDAGLSYYVRFAGEGEAEYYACELTEVGEPTTAK